jgi:hypothetical protein
MSTASTERAWPRVEERARAVALAKHYRTVEHLSAGEIAQRLGRSPATVRGYFFDPDASKARQAKQARLGTCPGCGASTSPPPPGGGRLCVRCKGRRERRWSRDLIIEALRAWSNLYGQRPTSTDLSGRYARRRGGERLQRLQLGWEQGRYPALSVVQYHFGSFAAADEAAFGTGRRNES